jgi:hypothetical protein
VNTTLRTSVHTCIVTREAVERTGLFTVNSVALEDLMPLPHPKDIVIIKQLEPPQTVAGGHIRAVFELTERVDAP